MLFLPKLARTIFFRLSRRQYEIRAWDELAAQFEGRSVSLAIVGNAGYLSEIEQGDYIDSHDLVVRMNNFRTIGYEREVGKKIDLFLTTFHGDVALTRPEIGSARLIVTSVPFNWSKPRGSGLKHRHAALITQGLSQLQRREAFVPKAGYFQSLLQSLGAYPTTGAMGLLLAVDFLLPVCRRIYVTGFSFFEGRSYYFGTQRVAPKNHNLEREQALLFRRLSPHVQSGRVRLDERLAACMKRRAA